MNYQHWAGYRRFVAGLSEEIATRRTWINGEWGLRFYAESAGGLPLRESQPVRPGEMVLTSPIAYPVTFTTGGGGLTPLAETQIESFVPFRIIGRDVRSAYSTRGGGPISTVYGTVYMTPPIKNLPNRNTDAVGEATLPLSLGISTAGLSVWFQGLDLSTGTLTNGVAVTIQ